MADGAENKSVSGIDAAEYGQACNANKQVLEMNEMPIYPCAGYRL